MNSDKTFDADEFLRRVSLEILQIIYLARGVDPQSTAWSPRGIWRSRVQDLWIAVEEEELPADIVGPAFTGLAMIQLSDLWECLIKPKQLNDERWDWARDFCQQWAKAQGMTLASPVRQANAGAVATTARGGSDTVIRPRGRRGGRKKGSGSLASKDEPLLKEMDNLIAQGKTPWSAAGAVADKADGSGAYESKQKRLVARHRKWKRSNSV